MDMYKSWARTESGPDTRGEGSFSVIYQALKDNQIQHSKIKNSRGMVLSNNSEQAKRKGQKQHNKRRGTINQPKSDLSKMPQGGTG